MKLGILCARDPAGQTGGAERFFEGLHAALRQRGCDATIVDLHSDESTFEAIEETYLRCYDFDASNFDALISTKAPTYLVRHPNHVCYLVHTVRVFYDMFEDAFPCPTPEIRSRRRLIHRLDTLALSPPRTRQVFAIGYEVARRLRGANGIDARVLHPPLGFDRFRTGSFGNYIFVPGRLHRWKRVDLAIEAIRRAKSPLRLVIAGTGEEESSLRALVHDSKRIEFLGRVSDDHLIYLYANALAVAFVPVREDYGYVTVEAFRSGKPVVTCSDSGEAALLVEDGVCGLVVAPTAADVAAAFDRLAQDRGLASRMGSAALAKSATFDWDYVVSALLSAVGRPGPAT